MKNKFLENILGEDGVEALNKAVSKLPLLRPVIVPRAVTAWLVTVGKIGFEGELPGIPDSYLSLTKSENAYTGALTVANELHTFENADILHVIASVSVAVGIPTEPIATHLQSKDLSKLGKSIDLLVKHELIKQIQADKAHKEEVKIAVEPAIAQILTKPEERLAPMAKSVKLLVSKPEQLKKCEECGHAQFKGGKFEGCLCFKDLAKSVVTVNIGTKTYIRFKPNLDRDAVEALTSVLKG